MRYGILSDIHANLEALQAVLDDLEQEKVDAVFFLGDVVGYGANPQECIELLQKLTPWIIAGNHDWATAGLTDTSFFNPIAKAAIEWTREKLPHHHQQWLTTLSLTKEYQDVFFVHGTPYQPEEWHYIFSLREAALNFSCFSQRVCFIGHSHTPLIFEQDRQNKFSVLLEKNIMVKDSCRYIINVGSVGQPRDGDPRAAYGIYCPDETRFTLKRIPYNIEQSQKKIIQSGLPPSLAWRLAAGR